MELSLFKKKTDAEPEYRGGNDAGKNRVSLLILLVLIAAFGYLYFFTSLIVPHETAQPAKSAEPAVTAQVKQSMPPRPSDTAAAPAATGGQPPAAGASAPPPAATSAPAAAPAAPAAKPPAPAAAPAAPAKATAVPAPAKTVPPQPAKKEEAKTVKPAEQKPAAPAAKKEAVKPVAAPAKPAQGKDKQPTTAAKPVAKEQKAATDKGKASAGKAKADTAAYMINVGEFAASEAASVEAKLGKHGIKPVKTVTQKNRMMTRLFYGAYTDYDTYSNELARLKQAASSAFAIEKNGRYSIYAGSFGSADRAAAEKKRLAAKGVSVELQQASLPLSTVRMSAGPFSSKPAADKAAAKLKGEGLVVKVLPKGK